MEKQSMVDGHDGRVPLHRQILLFSEKCLGFHGKVYAFSSPLPIGLWAVLPKYNTDPLALDELCRSFEDGWLVPLDLRGGRVVRGA